MKEEDEELGISGELSAGVRSARDSDGKTYSVPSEMSYNDWKETYVKDAMSKSDIAEYNKLVETLGNNAPKTIEEYYNLKYNSGEWDMYIVYKNAILRGELSSFADFKYYKDVKQEINEKLVGVITKNNIEVKSFSNHFIDRVIGSEADRRNGVSVDDCLKILLEADEISKVREFKHKSSQRFKIKGIGIVSINPETGQLIQVNPK